MIPNLPAELYNRYFLWKVGKSIGTMLKIDEHTSIHSREKFTRICVEVDLRKKLVPSFLALGKDFRLEYEATDEQNHRKGENATAVQGQPTTVNTGNHFRKDLIATENPRVMEVVVGTLKESHKHQSGEKESENPLGASSYSGEAHKMAIDLDNIEEIAPNGNVADIEEEPKAMEA
ncbi:hypothetical protein AHAS_Ahas15G0050400 [Arachis hypogaea]